MRTTAQTQDGSWTTDDDRQSAYDTLRIGRSDGLSELDTLIACALMDEAMRAGAVGAGGTCNQLADAAVEALTRAGVTEDEARDYVVGMV